MAPAALPFTFVIRKPSGTELWYFRHPSLSKPARISGRPGEPAFHRSYERLLSDATEDRTAATQRTDADSFRWLAEAYQASDEWAQLAAKTRSDYSRELKRLTGLAGDLSFKRLTSEGVRAMRSRVMSDIQADRQRAIDARAAQDAAARAAGRAGSDRNPPAAVVAATGARAADLFKSVLSALLGWAVEHDHLAKNSAAGVKRVHRKKNVRGHTPWTEHQIAAVLAKAPRHVADGVTVGLCTGQRLKDCLAATTDQIVGSVLRVRQSKTSAMIDVPITGDLIALVRRRTASNDQDDCKRLVTRPDGQPYSERLYSEHLRVFLDSLGWSDISFHGLRYAAAGRLNEAGCSVATISSIVGHSTYDMAMKYLSAREDSERAAVAMQSLADRSDAVA